MEFRIENNVINETVLNELKSHFFPPLQKIMQLIIAVIFIIIGIVFFAIYQGDTTMLAISLAVSVLLIFVPLLQQNQSVKLIMKRMYEAKGSNESVYNILLTENELKILTLENIETERYQYINFKRFAQTKSSYALFTKSNQLIVISKESVSLDKNQDIVTFVLDFLKMKCINIRKWN